MKRIVTEDMDFQKFGWGWGGGVCSNTPPPPPVSGLKVERERSMPA